MKIIKKEGRNPLLKKEEGIFGTEALTLFILFIISLFLVYAVNSAIVEMSWKGFITNMQPSYLYPDFDGGYGTYPGKNVVSAAMYLEQNVVMKFIVNSLFFIILLFLGLAYIYSDLFEQHFGKLKTMLPRVIFGLILAYTSLYIVEALMIMGKAGYLAFYNLPVFNAWKHTDYLTTVAPEIRIVSQNSPFATVNQVANIYWHYIWVFIIMAEAISLLVFVAFRMVLLAVLIVLLPIASILLIHPWTQSIGSRLWWLAIALIFLPIVMIIPLMLSTVVGNSVSFFVASLTAILGSIYLLVKEPFILSGLGFQRAGTLLTGGIIGGGVSGNLLAPSRVGTGMTQQAMGGLRGHTVSGAGIMVHRLTAGIREKLSKGGMSTLGATGGGGGETRSYSYSISNWASQHGGFEK